MDILETRGTYRVGIDYEQGPDEPFDDFASPLLRIDHSGRASFVDKGTMRPRDDDEYVIDAVQHWRTSPADRDWRLVEKYLRAFFGVTQIETFSSDDYWYVTYDSASWREATGSPPGSASLDDYKAWVFGEVYYYAIQELVTWHAINPAFDDEDRWETVASLGSYYGYDYAEQEARAAFEEYLDQQKGD